MSVLNFSYATIKDPAAFRDYVTKAAVLMQDMNIEVVLRAEFARTVRGAEKGAHIAAVFRFQDMAAAEAFYASEAYQPLVPLRDRACDMEIQFYAE